jgi:uncharacterized damage-inducible protein DinB
MQPEMALGAVQFMAQSIEQESKTTRNVLAAVPAGHETYRPHEKSMNTLELAWHLASSEVWFYNCIADGAFGHGEAAVPEHIKSAADVLAYYDQEHPAALAKLRAMDGAAATKVLDFMGMMQFPAVVFLSLASNHAIHHRGQLSVYLRPIGGKVPSIYGPSGDVPIGG